MSEAGCHEGLETHISEDTAERTTGDGKDHAFPKQLPDEPRATGSEGGALSHFPGAGASLGEQKTGYVAARDEQQQSHRGKQQQQRAFEVAKNHVVEAFHSYTKVLGVIIGVDVSQLAGNDIDIG